MLAPQVIPRTMPQMAQVIPTMNAAPEPPSPVRFDAAIHQVMPPITAETAHLEINLAGSSLFFNQRYKTQPMIPAHRIISRTMEIFDVSQFIECCSEMLSRSPGDSLGLRFDSPVWRCGPGCARGSTRCHN